MPGLDVLDAHRAGRQRRHRVGGEPAPRRRAPSGAACGRRSRTARCSRPARRSSRRAPPPGVRYSRVTAIGAVLDDPAADLRAARGRHRLAAPGRTMPNREQPVTDMTDRSVTDEHGPVDVPDPSLIMQVGMGFWPSKTLLTAVELGLFTALGTACRALPTNWPTRSDLRSRAVADFLDALVALRLLERDGSGAARRTGTPPRPQRSSTQRARATSAASWRCATRGCTASGATCLRRCGPASRRTRSSTPASRCSRSSTPTRRGSSSSWTR